MSYFRKEVADTSSNFSADTTDTKTDQTSLTLTGSISMSDLGKPSIPSIQSESHPEALHSTPGQSAEEAATSVDDQPPSEAGQSSKSGYGSRVEQMCMSAQATVCQCVGDCKRKYKEDAGCQCLTRTAIGVGAAACVVGTVVGSALGLSHCL